jgi:hypothetical protein
VTPSRLPRRVTGVFLLALVFVFGLLWLSQIATAAMSGVRPQALVDAGWPTSPIYVLDLAFVLPLCAVTGVGLLRRRGDSLGAIPLLVFASLIAVGILSISLFASVDGQSLDGMQIAIFVVVATASALLAWLGLTPKRSPAADSRGLHPAQTASSTKNTSKTCVDF